MVQEFDFAFTHAKGSAMVVPKSLSRDAIPHHRDIHASSRCILLMRTKTKITSKLVFFFRKSDLFGVAVYSNRVVRAQSEEFGDAEIDARERQDFCTDKDGIPRADKDGDRSVVVSETLNSDVLEQVHCAKFTGHYRKAQKAEKKVW